MCVFRLFMWHRCYIVVRATGIATTAPSCSQQPGHLLSSVPKNKGIIFFSGAGAPLMCKNRCVCTSRHSHACVAGVGVNRPLSHIFSTWVSVCSKTPPFPHQCHAGLLLWIFLMGPLGRITPSLLTSPICKQIPGPLLTDLFSPPG